MQIGKTGKTSDVFASELADKMAQFKPSTTDKNLTEQRQDMGHEPTTKTEEANLRDEEVANRKNEPLHETTEKQLDKYDPMLAAPNKDKEGLTEKRLNDASTQLYPHRNDAATRTGDKRPINALPEEMGKASDQDKRERWEKASKAAQGEKRRLLDKDPGSQMTNPKTTFKGKVYEGSFNLKRIKTAKIAESLTWYSEYKTSPKNEKYAKARRLDSEMRMILIAATNENRELTEDEKKRIFALKAARTESLKG